MKRPVKAAPTLAAVAPTALAAPAAVAPTVAAEEPTAAPTLLAVAPTASTALAAVEPTAAEACTTAPAMASKGFMAAAKWSGGLSPSGPSLPASEPSSPIAELSHACWMGMTALGRGAGSGSLVAPVDPFFGSELVGPVVGPVVGGGGSPGPAAGVAGRLDGGDGNRLTGGVSGAGSGSCARRAGLPLLLGRVSSPKSAAGVLLMAARRPEGIQVQVSTCGEVSK